MEESLGYNGESVKLHPSNKYVQTPFAQLLLY